MNNWRDDSVTERQIELLRELGLNIPETKGIASDLITAHFTLMVVLAALAITFAGVVDGSKICIGLFLLSLFGLIAVIRKEKKRTRAWALCDPPPLPQNNPPPLPKMEEEMDHQGVEKLVPVAPPQQSAARIGLRQKRGTWICTCIRMIQNKSNKHSTSS